MRSFRSIQLWGVPLALIVLASSCASDFDPPSYLKELRLLAVVSDPLEAGPEEEVTLTPVLFLPEGEALKEQSWSFCPYSLGSAQGYACAVTECERDLTAEANGVLVASPGLWAMECALSFEGEDLPLGLPQELPEMVEVVFRYHASTEGGQEVEAVFTLPLWATEPPLPRNTQPLIEGFEFGGVALEAGQEAAAVALGEERTVRVRVDPGSLDPYQDESGEDRIEEALVSFYATAGRFAYDREAGTDVTVSWEAISIEDGQDKAQIYAVVRDMRGGQAVVGPFVVPLKD